MQRSFPILLILLGPLMLAACSHTGNVESRNVEPVRVMTFNIRLDLASDGANAWARRKAMVFALIRHEAPDLLGMQEVLSHQKRDLEAALPGYSMIGVGREDGKEAGEFVPLAWRRDRFDLMQSGTFWLSPTPRIPGQAWDAALPRIASWALLRDAESGRFLRVLNTHFDHVGVVAKVNSAALIGRWAADGAAAEIPVIVMGDFNFSPSSEAYRQLTNGVSSSLVDSRADSITPPYGPRGTFTGFNIESFAAEPIDHIFISRDFVVVSHSTITQHWGGRLPSDHYPVMAILRIANP